jgi:hypothetical protein
MGLSWHSLKFLCEAKGRNVVFDHIATIGRQNCFVSAPRILRIFVDYGIVPPPGPIELTRNPEYSEPVLTCLGANRIDSIDNSSYESATKVWDMNRPIPEDWHEQYDLLFDGGSIEHIFNIPQALANYMSLVRVGGHVIIDTMANNWAGHGFYQFSPELFYRVFAPENGFTVERLVMYECYEHAPMYEVPDPASIRSRIELSNSWVGVMIAVLARRTERLTPFARWPQQSDYASVWVGHDSAPASAPPPRPSARRRFIDAMKRRLPRLVGLKHEVLYSYPWLTRAWNRHRSRVNHQRRSFTTQPDRFRPARAERHADHRPPSPGRPDGLTTGRAPSQAPLA